MNGKTVKVNSRLSWRILSPLILLTTIQSGCKIFPGASSRPLVVYSISEISPTSDVVSRTSEPLTPESTPQAVASSVLKEKCKRSNGTLLVGNTTAPRSIDSWKILFTHDGLSVGSYQFAIWSEPPTHRLPAILRERISKDGIFEAVTSPSSTAVPDLILLTDIAQFHQDLRSGLGQTIVTIDVQLDRAKQRTVVAEKVFSHASQVTEDSASGAVKAFRESVNVISNEIATWVAEYWEKEYCLK